MAQKKFNLIKPKDIDVDSFDFNIELYLDFVKNQKGKIIGSNEKGLIFLVKYQQGYSAMYLFVKEQFRDNNVENDLLDSAMEYCRRLKKWFYMKVVYNDNVSTLLENYAIEKKMLKNTPQIIRIIGREATLPDNIKWLDERTINIRQRLINQGFKTVKFFDSPKIVIDKLREYLEEKDPEKRQLPYDMNPFWMKHRDDDFCFMTYKGDEPVTVLAASHYSDSLVIETYFCLKNYWNTGAFLPVIVDFSNAAFSDPNIQRVSIMNLTTNKMIMPIIEKYFIKFVTKNVEQVVYYQPVAPKK